MKFKLQILFVFQVIVIFFGKGLTQISNLGNYSIVNFSYDDFKSPVQIYTCSEFIDGSIVFGNKEKLIRYDGVNWSFINTDTSSFLTKGIQTNNMPSYRVYHSSNNKYYATRDHIFGEIIFNENGNVVLQPIYTGTHLSDMWNIQEDLAGNIIFHSRDSIFKHTPLNNKTDAVQLPKDIQNGQVTNIAKSRKGIIISLSYRENSELLQKYGQDRFVLWKTDSNIFHDISIPENFKAGKILETFLLNDEEFITYENNGIFPLKEDTNKVVYIATENNIFDNVSSSPVKVRIKDSSIYLATETNGIVVFNLEGEKRTAFTDRNGLQDNNIYDFIFDSAGNIWLALDNGVSVIGTSSPSAFWRQEHGVIGGIESIEIKGDDIFILSRTKGVLKSYEKNDKLYFSPNSTIREATYDLELANTINGVSNLVVGYSGIFEIDDYNTTSTKLLDGVYAWKLYGSKKSDNKVYVGGEGFFGIMHEDDNKWNYEDIFSLDDDVRSIIETVGYIYFSVKGEGVYRWQENEKPELIETEKIDIQKTSPFYIEELGYQARS
jgi:hypothetical protein